MLSVEFRIVLVFLTSLFIALFAMPKLSSIALRLGLMDEPNNRKIHTQPKPLVGGLGMIIAATFSSMLFVPMAGMRGLFLGLAILLFIGFLDDFLEIGPKRKFFAQIIAACSMIYFSKALLFSFGDLLGFGELLIPGGVVIAWAVTIFCVVGVINSVNLIDGLDGLAGGIACIAFFYFAAHASFAGNVNLMMLNLALAGAVLGFLHFNWHPAKLFMGDAGSLCLGFALAFMAIVSSQGESSALQPVSALLILAVPITDTVVVMTKRLMRRQNPFVADKTHLHHVFLRYGLERERAVCLILLISGGLGGLTLLAPLYSVPESALFTVYVLYFVGYFLTSFYVTNFFRIISKHRRRRRRNTESISRSKLVNTLFGAVDLLQVYRKAPRYSVRLACKLDLGGKIVEGKVFNMSRTGCLIQLNSELDPKSRVRLLVNLPLKNQRKEVEAEIENLWSREEGRAVFHGVRFLDMSLEFRETVAAYLNQLKRGRKKYMEPDQLKEGVGG